MAEGRRPTEFDDEVKEQAARYATHDPAPFRGRLALGIILSFGVCIALVLFFLLDSVRRNAYDERYLTILSTIGTMFAGATGAVLTYYFSSTESR